MFKIVDNELPLKFWLKILLLYKMCITSYKTNYIIFFLPSISNSLAQNQLAFRGTEFWSELNANLKHLILLGFKKYLKKICSKFINY